MKALVSSMCAALCLASALQLLQPPLPRFLFNTSQSAPIGWYRLERSERYHRGMKVAAFAPAIARHFAAERGYLPAHIPLIKTIWAVSGDEICIQNQTLFASGQPNIEVDLRDSKGRLLPKMSGCFILKAHEYFLVSTDVQASWDSRYFGPVAYENILGKVTFRGPTLWSAAQRWAGHG